MTIEVEEGESLTIKTCSGVVVLQHVPDTRNYIVGVNPQDGFWVERMGRTRLSTQNQVTLLVKERET